MSGPMDAEDILRRRVRMLEETVEAMSRDMGKMVLISGEQTAAIQRSNEGFVRLGAEMQEAVTHMENSFASLQPIVEIAKGQLMKTPVTLPSDDEGGDDDHHSQGEEAQ